MGVDTHVGSRHKWSLIWLVCPPPSPFIYLFVCSFVPPLAQEEDFLEMINTSRVMETQYGYLFDKVIVNDDLTSAFSDLKGALQKLETEAHWVPISWTHS